MTPKPPAPRAIGKHPALAAPYGIKRKVKFAPTERSLKIDLSAIGKSFVGMSLEDMSLVGKLAASIQKLPRKARKRVVAALGSISA